MTEKTVLIEEGFLKENNQFAMEDLERRLLELEGMGLWKPDPEILEALKQDYLDIEGMMEDVTDDPDCQRGEVIITKMTDEYHIGAMSPGPTRSSGKGWMERQCRNPFQTCPFLDMLVVY